MSEIQKIKCPKCDHKFHVEDVLHKDLQKKFEKEYALKAQEQEEKLERQREDLKIKEAAFQEKRDKQNEIFAEKLKDELKKKEKALKKEVKEQQSEKLKAIEEKLEEEKEKAKAAGKLELELKEMKAAMKDQEEDIKLKLQKELLDKKEDIEAKVIQREAERYEMKMKEMTKQLEDQKKLTEEMKRKQEQGSMQLQGEVQELAIEDWLRSQFPLDEITEIKKGERGGDCIQTVHTREFPNCGKIYYESKRTKAFQPTWIEKFKTDMRVRGVELGVIITEAMPKDMDRMGQKEGVWICTYEEFKGLSLVLRDSIIRLGRSLGAQENKGDKMHMLYDYLTGSEFKMQLEAIMEGYMQMSQDIVKEKNAMARLWKQREKQLEKVLLNANNFYGSIKGIAGNAVPTIPQLELGEEEADGQMELEV